MKLAVVLALVALACRPQPKSGDGASFDVPPNVGRLVVDEGAFARFAKDLRPQLERVADPNSVFILAMLDALDERWESAVSKLDQIAARERDPDTRELRGLTIRVWADSRSNDEFHTQLAAHVDRLPKKLVPQLSDLRAMANALTPEVCRRLVEDHVGSRGEVTLEDIHVIVFQRYAVVRIVPVAQDIDDVLAARGVDLPDR